MKSSEIRARYLIARLYAEHQKEIGLQKYESEFQRWVDLAVSLLITISNVPEENIEAAARMLISLDLLNIELCEKLPELKEESKVFSDILYDFGFSIEEAELAKKSISEIAKALVNTWHGKIQYYLRSWGERMLEDMVSSFPLNGLSADEVKYAYARWLQIAANMPILLPHETITEYADAQGSTIEKLITAADMLDLNVAFLDEVIGLEYDLTDEE